MRIHWVALPALFVSCSTDHAATSASVLVEDSAGVTVTRSDGPTWEARHVWRIAQNPTLSIGAEHDGRTAGFRSIVSATRLQDGRIVVADRGNDEIQIFSPTGDHLKTVGRPGDGPGEFRRLQAVAPLPDDSLYAFDERLMRVSIFDDTAGFVRVAPLPRYLAAVQRLPDGRWVGATSEGAVGTGSTATTPSGLLRPKAEVILMDPAFNVVDTIASSLGYEVYVGQVWGRRSVMPAPFGYVFSMAARGDEILISSGEVLGYDVVSGEGRHLSAVRALGEEPTISDEEASAYREAMLGGLQAGPVRENLEELMDQAELPAGKALVSDLLSAPNGTVWLSAYQNFRYYTGRWHVMDPQGAYLGVVQLPESFLPLEAGDDYLLGRWRDDLGVSSIRLYEIIK